MELVQNLGLFGIAEVKAVGDSQRFGAAYRYVAGGLGYGNGTASEGVKIDVAAVAIHTHGQPFRRAFNAEHSSVRTRQDHRVAPHLMVILPVDPLFAGDSRRTEQNKQHLIKILRQG